MASADGPVEVFTGLAPALLGRPYKEALTVPAASATSPATAEELR